MNIKVPRIYTPNREVWVLVEGRNAMPGEMLWCDGTRKSSLGGYIGKFRRTYRHTGNMISPRGEQFEIHMRDVDPVE